MDKMELMQIHLRDNVAVALSALPEAAQVTLRSKPVQIAESIPFGHKVALEDIEEGMPIIKYGYSIGKAVKPIHRGEHIHTHNLKTGLEGQLEYTYAPVPQAKLPQVNNATFQGYLREDGRAGVRNEIWIIPTVGCVNATVRKLAEEGQRRFGHLCDGVVAYEHPYGCSQLGGDHQTTQKVLAGLAKHPNAGGILLVSLGCENNHLKEFLPVLGSVDEKRVKAFVTQEVPDELEKGLELVEGLAGQMSQDKRQPLSMDKLVVGLKCGGSDAFSGITANALCGAFSDLLVGGGGTTMLTEVPEMFGAEHILMERADSTGTFQKIVGLINGFKSYYEAHDQPVYENPSPGNKAGGITTLEEKSLGCIQKGGSVQVVDVLDYGEQVKIRGLNLLNGPGNDLVAVTNLAAAGAQIILFTTGRGTPAGSPVPTIKISSNDQLAERKANWIDFNAGGAVKGRPLEAFHQEFFQYVLDVASGEKKAMNEINGFRDFAIFKNGVTL